MEKNDPSTTPQLADIWPRNRYWAWIYPQSDCDEQVEDNGGDRIADWAKTGSQCNPLKWGMPWIWVDFRDGEFQLQSMNPSQNQEQIWNRIWIYVARALDRQNCSIMLKGPPLPFFISSLTYLIIVADAADAVSVNFSDRCKFLQI